MKVWVHLATVNNNQYHNNWELFCNLRPLVIYVPRTNKRENHKFILWNVSRTQKNRASEFPFSLYPERNNEAH